MIVAVGIVALIGLASDSLTGASRLANLDLDRQRAAYAAETVASMIEAKLAGGTLDDFKKDIKDDAATRATWWNLRGCCYTDPDSGAYHPAATGLWLNGCVVRWRLEPVKIYATALPAGSTADPDATYTVNSEDDPNLAPTRTQDAQGANNTGTLYAKDPGFYHFRIVTEAYALVHPRDADATPWSSSGQSTASAQAQRVVQIQKVNLFKYALFHAQPSPVGDLDLQTGRQLSVQKGAIHTNGAIYIRGGENRGFTASPRDYHVMACGDDGEQNTTGVQSIILGSADAPITVTGVAGIFRMGKTANLLAMVDSGFEAQMSGYANNPLTIPNDPTALNSAWINADSTRRNPNGDVPTSNRHSINGVSFTSTNDSRDPAQMTTSFRSLVRDRQNGGAPVNTLSNIPELGGRPFEYQRQVGPGLFRIPYVLYRNSGVVSLINQGAQPLYYATSGVPQASDVRPGPPTDPAFPLVNPEGMRLYWDATYAKTDVDATVADNPLLNNAVLGVDHDFPDLGMTYGDGFSDREVKGYFLEKALFGATMTSQQYYAATIPASLPSTGLTIRERPMQVGGTIGAPATTPRPDAATLPGPLYNAAMAAYLISQYEVFFAGRNITNQFFNDILTAPDDNPAYREANFIATEDEFVDTREASYMAGMYGIDPKAFPGMGPGGTPGSYRTNVLTLNLRRTQDFLKTTVATTLGLPPSSSTFAKDYFNGLIYIHRTRRSVTFDPIKRPDLAWRAPPANLSAIAPVSLSTYVDHVPGANPGLYVTPDVTLGNATPDLTNIREGNGPPETTRCGVRIRGGLAVDATDPADPDDARRAQFAAVDWNHGASGVGDLGTSGLTIVTPDRLYLWGDYNTVQHPDSSGVLQTTPCAVMADGVTALSASFSDQAWQTYTTDGSWPPKTYQGHPDATSTRYITSFVINNVPNAAWNVDSFGAAGDADLVHLMERWSSATFTYKGSLVVMNSQHYSYALHYYTASPLSNGVRVFETGTANVTFNTDLFKPAGLPPFSLPGTIVTRVISTVDYLGR